MFSFQKIAKTTLILVYLVIVAGAVVRMTGSGMGCPDWPKCFGYYIPPTEISQLLWKPKHDYKKGQIIIREQALWVAKSDFTSTTEYQPERWQAYTKHSYAIFNPIHTWVEYINRLFGALSGFATLALAIASFGFWKNNKKITLLSVLLVFAMGFQAWLGATVVYSVLNPFKITLHMLMALVIVTILIYLIYKTQPKTKTQKIGSKKLRALLIVALITTLIQVVLGTQVRQWVDHFSATQISGFKTLSVPWSFYIHRSFSALVLFLNIYLWQMIRKEKIQTQNMNWVVALLIITIMSGISMFYWDFPFGMQSLHLVTSALIFGLQFYITLQIKSLSK
ncbi:hypothetical protein CAPN006_02160 [Capnocytophaga canimorsus]|uniref:Heme A synthase n=1 Tax=Capnocytophaga canimorsus TaxID=28188 RepID=A0AAC9Z4C0_9FLAO|nr:COX15/CtaA family protein [Capnocytophaga canimorsus]ATA93497.1 heme A synthase [Capnocytophaga canimorsus]GIM55822.1 hypothetical protein CAPN006_02160 [Capnocytophaga canimorsus]